MRDRNEKASEAASASLVPIPIGLVALIHITKIRTISRNNRGRFMLGQHTKTMMAWKPKEIHKFWNRLVKETDV